MLPVFQNSRVSNILRVAPSSFYLPRRHTSTDLEAEARKKGLGQGYGAEIGIQAPDPHPHPSTWVAALLIPQDSAAIICLEQRMGRRKAGLPCLLTLP